MDKEYYEILKDTGEKDTLLNRMIYLVYLEVMAERELSDAQS